MRHFLLLALPISSSSGCMIDTSTKGLLIALSCKKNGFTTSCFRAMFAIDIAAIAMTTDQNLAITMRTVVETG
jgi:hypothetical protein